MTYVYLDQNFWIDLARADAGQPGREGMEDALAVVRHTAENHLASFPLSSTHYVETYKRRDPISRQQLGKFMAEISRGVTIAHTGTLLEPELEHALHLRFGRPPNPVDLRVFGEGVGHAFGQADFEISLDESMLARLTPAQRHQIQLVARDFWNLASIAGPPFELPAEGIHPPTPFYSERWAKAQNELVERLSEHQPDGDKTFVQRVTAAQEFTTTFEEHSEILERHDVAQTEIFHDDVSIEELNSFLKLMPVRWIVSEMRRVGFGDRQRTTEPNDLEDLVALALAAVHCDVVAGERYWTGVIRRSDAEPHTTVVSTPQDLVTAIIDRTSQHS